MGTEVCLNFRLPGNWFLWIDSKAWLARWLLQGNVYVCVSCARIQDGRLLRHWRDTCAHIYSTNCFRYESMIPRYRFDSNWKHWANSFTRLRTRVLPYTMISFQLFQLKMLNVYTNCAYTGWNYCTMSTFTIKINRIWRVNITIGRSSFFEVKFFETPSSMIFFFQMGLYIFPYTILQLILHDT